MQGYTVYSVPIKSNSKVFSMHLQVYREKGRNTSSLGQGGAS
jgi:hypothetical protein